MNTRHLRLHREETRFPCFYRKECMQSPTAEYEEECAALENQCGDCVSEKKKIICVTP